jgi:Coenzyme PQQ synthesis protein D (PqqD)
MARKKRPIPKVAPPAPETPAKRSWWRKSDAELLTERTSELKSTLGIKKVKLDDKDRSELILEVRRRDPSIPNLLDAVFCKVGTVEADGEFLKVPVYRSRKGESVASALHLKTRRRVRLDDYGWAVWASLDGKRTIEEVGVSLKERFGDEVEPLYPRLAKFITYLANLGLIRDVKRP